ncbi:MAG: SRPBCC domain-containing protein [Mucilaginibacter sp.]
MAKIIKHQFFFAHPAETVWDYLTNSELIAQWLMKNDFKLILGHDFTFRTTPVPAIDFDGIFYCTVLEIVHLKSLSYSWNCGPGNAEITLESVVTWNLLSKEKGTEVILEHRGFAKKTNLDMYSRLLHGWVEKLAKINELLNASAHGNTNP